MGTLIKMTVVSLILMVLVILPLGCQKQEGPAERAGKEIDKVINKSGEQVKEVSGKVKEATEKTGKEIDKAMESVAGQIEKAGKKIQDATQEAKK